MALRKDRTDTDFQEVCRLSLSQGPTKAQQDLDYNQYFQGCSSSSTFLTSRLRGLRVQL